MLVLQGVVVLQIDDGGWFVVWVVIVGDDKIQIVIQCFVDLEVVMFGWVFGLVGVGGYDWCVYCCCQCLCQWVGIDLYCYFWMDVVNLCWYLFGGVQQIGYWCWLGLVELFLLGIVQVYQIIELSQV